MQPNSLNIDEVQVWGIPLGENAPLYADCESFLARDEIVRADRFVTDELRRRFVICRGQLRRLIATTIGTTPDAVHFRYGQWGKPQLASSSSQPLFFNVSHSGDWAMIALALSPVGVDLEIPNDRITPRSIASQIVNEDERLAWDQLPARTHDLLTMQLWVCKEAILKALGLGIAEGLHKISFALPIPENVAFSPNHIDPSLQLHFDDDGSCRTNSWTDPHTWRVQLLDRVPEYAVPGCLCALATQRHIRHISFRSM